MRAGASHRECTRSQARHGYCELRRLVGRSPSAFCLLLGASAATACSGDARTRTDAGSVSDAHTDDRGDGERTLGDASPTRDASLPLEEGAIVVRVTALDPHLVISRPVPPTTEWSALVHEHSGPAAGAAVALDLADGERREALTDAMGIARFDAIDVRRGPAIATAWLDGSISMETRFGVAIGSEIELFVSEAPTGGEVDPRVTFILEGTCTGTADRAGEVILGMEPTPSELATIGPEVIGGYGYFDEGVATYEATFATDARTTLAVVEHVRRPTRASVTRREEVLAWSQIDVGPFAAARERLDLDLAAHAVTPDRIATSFGVHSTDPYADVIVRTRRGTLSFVEEVSLDPVTLRATATLALARLRPDDEVFTEHHHERAYVRRLGYPTAGDVTIDWPARAILRSPPEPGPADPPRLHPPHEPIRWIHDDIPPTALSIMASYTSWLVTFPEGTTEITLPRPPAGHDLAELFREPVTPTRMRPRALLLQCELGTGVLADRCARQTSSTSFELAL